MQYENKFSGTTDLIVENAVNPYFMLYQDSSYAYKLLRSSSGKPEFKELDINRLSEAKSEIKYAFEGENLLKEKEGYYFLELPKVMNSFYYGHYSPPASERTRKLDIGNPINESYSFTIVAPEEYVFVNKEVDIKRENSAGKLLYI